MNIELSLRVLAFETDYGNVVSNTRYLEYIERGRYALLHKAGLNVTRLWDELGVQPVVRAVNVEYLGFARHEDELILRAEVTEHTNTTTRLAYECRRASDNGVTMRASQTLAYINRSWRPTRVPTAFREALQIEPQRHEDTEKESESSCA